MIRRSKNASRTSKAAAAWLAIATLVPGAAGAQTQTLPDRWQFNAILYGYFPQIGGSITFPTGTPVNVGVDPSDYIGNLKFAFMGWLSAQKGAIGMFTDIFYADMSGSKSATRDFSIGNIGIPAGVTADADLHVKTTLWTLAGSYRLMTTPDAAFDVLAGARMIDLKQNLGYQLSADVGPLVGPGRQGSSDVNLTHWDAIVGARGRFNFGDRRQWFVPYYADVGGGQDKLTWQIFGGLGYEFGSWQIIGVWRYIDYRFKENDASLTMNGPAVGIGFTW